VIGVRTYWFPGGFYEANPGSSTRYIGIDQLHVEASTPPCMCTSNGSRRQTNLGYVVMPPSTKTVVPVT
jgi:hypothetical protein